MNGHWSFLLSWLGLGPLLLISGRNVACYYPFLLSAKRFVVVKNPKLRQFLISDSKNRSSSTKTRVEDRDKMSILGLIYYVLQAILLPACYSSSVGMIIADNASSVGLLLGQVRLFSASGSLGIFLLIFILSWLDYGLGKLFKP